jgi:hypothetical protein
MDLKHEGRTEIYTLFTKVGDSNLLYSADKAWVRVRLRLETAGPVAVSTREDVQPVLSGKGALLYDEDRVLTIPKGSRLWYGAQSVNRVAVVIEPVPWLEQMMLMIGEGFEKVIEALTGVKPTPPKTGAKKPILRSPFGGAKKRRGPGC